MKKRFLALVCAAVLALVATTYAAVQIVTDGSLLGIDDADEQNPEEMLQSVNIGTEPIVSLDRFDRMVEKLSGQIEDDADFNITLVNYKFLENGYKLDTAVMNYISDLIISGYNGIDVIDCTYFWLDTNENISIVKEMCEWKIKNSDYSGKFWEENAFNAITNDKCGVLSEEDLNEYTSKGISIEKIMIANRLCRKGVYTIQEILEKYENGATMADIAIEIDSHIYGEKNSGAALTYSMANATKVSDGEIFASRELSMINSEPEAAYYNTAEDTTDITAELDEASERITEGIKEELKTGGYFRTKEMEAE